jgi:hypothetical protein
VLLEVVSFFYQTIAVKSTDAWHVLYVGAKIDGTITLMTFFGQNEDSYRVEEFSPDFLLGLLSLKLDPHTMITVSDSYSRIIANKTVVTLHLGKPYKNRGAIVVRKDALLEAIKHVKPIVE